MKAKYFRIFFQNKQEGICHSLSLWNTYCDCKTNMVYLSGAGDDSQQMREEDTRFAKETHEIDLLVIADLNLVNLQHAIRLLEGRKVTRVVMPYLSKAEREKQGAGIASTTKEEKQFLADPYAYAMAEGVEEFFYLKGNDAVNQGGELQDGTYFTAISSEEAKGIEEQEGQALPIYRAGTIIKNEWLYRFGVFQGKEFPTLTLYHGSLADDTKRDDCVMCAKPFSKEDHCCTGLCQEENFCALSCTHRGDFDLLKRQCKKGECEYVTGTLLLGNMVLEGQVEALKERYAFVKKKVRFLSIPNGGEKANWDTKVLDFGAENQYCYVVGANGASMDAQVVRAISGKSPYMKFAPTNETYGWCGSGFLKERE